MSDDEDRRVHEADRLARIEVHQENMVSTLARIETAVNKTNGRVTDLEKDANRSAWIVRALGIIGLGALAKAFQHG